MVIFLTEKADNENRGMSELFVNKYFESTLTLIDKIEKSDKFNQGFKTVEYLAASYLDMAWHTLAEEKTREGYGKVSSYKRNDLVADCDVVNCCSWCFF